MRRDFGRLCYSLDTGTGIEQEIKEKFLKFKKSMQIFEEELFKER